MIELLGHALAAACGDRAVLARIGGALGEAACAEAVLLATLGEPGARARRAASTAAARAPVPPGLRGIDPTWIEAALAGLPDRARTALAEGPAGEAEVWLVRRVCAGLVPLPAIDPALTRPRLPAAILRMSVPALRAWLVEVGRDQLAFALGEHAPSLGPTLALAITRIVRPPRHGELGPRRAAVERAKGEALVIGVRTIAPHLEPMLGRALVQRFPHPEGRALAAELTTHAAARSASWSAVIAP